MNIPHHHKTELRKFREKYISGINIAIVLFALITIAYTLILELKDPDPDVDPMDISHRMWVVTFIVMLICMLIILSYMK